MLDLDQVGLLKKVVTERNLSSYEAHFLRWRIVLHLLKTDIEVTPLDHGLTGSQSEQKTASRLESFINALINVFDLIIEEKVGQAFKYWENLYMQQLS